MTGSGPTPLLTPRRYRLVRASWISNLPLGSPSRRRPPARGGRIDPGPVATGGERILSRSWRRPGISPAARPSALLPTALKRRYAGEARPWSKPRPFSFGRYLLWSAHDGH